MLGAPETFACTFGSRCSQIQTLILKVAHSDHCIVRFTSVQVYSFVPLCSRFVLTEFGMKQPSFIFAAFVWRHRRPSGYSVLVPVVMSSSARREEALTRNMTSFSAS